MRDSSRTLFVCGYKPCAVFSFVAMDQIRSVVVNDKAHTRCYAAQGRFGEKIHAQIHIRYLTGAVIGVLCARGI